MISKSLFCGIPFHFYFSVVYFFFFFFHTFFRFPFPQLLRSAPTTDWTILSKLYRTDQRFFFFFESRKLAPGKEKDVNENSHATKWQITRDKQSLTSFPSMKSMNFQMLFPFSASYHTHPTVSRHKIDFVPFTHSLLNFITLFTELAPPHHYTTQCNCWKSLQLKGWSNS